MTAAVIAAVCSVVSPADGVDRVERGSLVIEGIADIPEQVSQ